MPRAGRPSFPVEGVRALWYARGALEGKEPELSALARVYREAAPWLSAAWQFTGSALAGVVVGVLVDRQVGTKPWGLVVGGVAGSALGLAAFMRQAMKLLDSKSKS